MSQLQNEQQETGRPRLTAVMEEQEQQEQFNLIYRENYRLLRHVAYGITGCLHTSEELTQEAFIRYYERMDKLPRGKEARYWLIRVVKNLSFNHSKRKGREYAANQKYLREPQTELYNQGEQEILKEESCKEVREALMALPLKLRSVLVLKEYSGMSYKEIGDILKISEGNVKVRVFRARKQLSGILGEGDNDVS